MAIERPAQPTECFEFTWWRRKKGPGFRWISGQKGHEILVGPPDGALLAYEPLRKETGLFLTFAALDGSKEQFLWFANTYGRLGTYHFLPPQKELWASISLDTTQISELLEFVKENSNSLGYMNPLFVFAAHTGARKNEMLRSRIEGFRFADTSVVIPRDERKRGIASTRRDTTHP